MSLWTLSFFLHLVRSKAAQRGRDFIGISFFDKEWEIHLLNLYVIRMELAIILARKAAVVGSPLGSKFSLAMGS